jgi:hypothetical protein
MFAVRFDRAGAGFAHGKAHFVKQRLVHAAAAGYRGGDKPRGPHVGRQRREGDFDGGHGLR